MEQCQKINERIKPATSTIWNSIKKINEKIKPITKENAIGTVY